MLRPGPSTVGIPGSNPTLLWARARRYPARVSSRRTRRRARAEVGIRQRAAAREAVRTALATKQALLEMERQRMRRQRGQRTAAVSALGVALFVLALVLAQRADDPFVFRSVAVGVPFVTWSVIAVWWRHRHPDGARSSEHTDYSGDFDGSGAGDGSGGGDGGGGGDVGGGC